MLSLKFSDKLYVGFQTDRYKNAESPRTLGFAVPYDDTKASQSRQETVDRWAGKDHTPRILDNVPLSGFKIVDTVARYSTSNKLFRVEDPRGFELEIPVDNLLHLIENSTIVNGLVVGEYVWAQRNGVYLISANSPEYKLYKNPPKMAPLAPGQYFKNKAGTIIYRYEGIFFYTSFCIDQETNYGNYRNYGTYNHEVATSVRYTIRRKHDAKVSVYSSWIVDADGNANAQTRVDIRKSKFKDLLPVDINNYDSKIQEFVLPLEVPLNDPSIVVNSNIDGWSAKYALFLDKDEQFNRKYDVHFLNEMHQPLGRRRARNDYYGFVTYNISDDVATDGKFVEVLKEKQEYLK